MKVYSYQTCLDVLYGRCENENNILEEMRKRYMSSTKVLRFNKKKAVISKINFELPKRKKQNEQDSVYKKVLLLLNKLSETNFSTIVQELRNIHISDYASFMRIADNIVKKTITESTYLDLYISLLMELSELWIVSFDEDTTIDIMEMYIIRVQFMFEDKILICEKKEGVRLMHIIHKLFTLKLIPSKVLDDIVDDLLQKSQEPIFVEYVIILVNSPSYYRYHEIRQQLRALPNLGSRLLFMLDG